MALSEGKTGFRNKINTGKAAWVNEMIAVENEFLNLYGAPPLSNTIEIGEDVIETNNLDHATERLEKIYDKWAGWMESIVFEAIKDLFVDHGEVLPNTLNAGRLPINPNPPTPVVLTPGTIGGKGKIQ